MREGATYRISNLCKTVLSKCDEMGEELSVSALSIMAKYVDWTDINSYSDDATLEMLHRLRRTKPGLRPGITNLFCAMVHKGMNSWDKFQLSMRISPKNIVEGAVEAMRTGEQQYLQAGSRLVAELFTALTENLEILNQEAQTSTVDLLSSLLPYVLSILYMEKQLDYAALAPMLKVVQVLADSYDKEAAMTAKMAFDPNSAVSSSSSSSLLSVRLEERYPSGLHG